MKCDQDNCTFESDNVDDFVMSGTRVTCLPCAEKLTAAQEAAVKEIDKTELEDEEETSVTAIPPTAQNVSDEEDTETFVEQTEEEEIETERVEPQQ